MKKLILAVILVLTVLGGTVTFVSAGIGVPPAHADRDGGGSDGEMPVPAL